MTQKEQWKFDDSWDRMKETNEEYCGLNNIYPNQIYQKVKQIHDEIIELALLLEDTEGDITEYIDIEKIKDIDNYRIYEKYMSEKISECINSLNNATDILQELGVEE